jgi:hypothetical protein
LIPKETNSPRHYSMQFMVLVVLVELELHQEHRKRGSDLVVQVLLITLQLVRHEVFHHEDRRGTFKKEPVSVAFPEKVQ